MSQPGCAGMKCRSIRDELAFLLDSTVDLEPKDYDRETLLMRLECSFNVRLAEAGEAAEECRAALRDVWVAQDDWCSKYEAVLDRVLGALRNTPDRLGGEE